MAPDRPDLPCTSSATSISSDDGGSVDCSFKRTRKRFSSLQLTMLEQLFHRTSHPTRGERELLAVQLQMSVFKLLYYGASPSC